MTNQQRIRQAAAIARIQELQIRRSQCVEISRRLELMAAEWHIEALAIDKQIDAEREGAK